MGKYFGTDGFRGNANEGLTVEHAIRIGRFLGRYYGRDHKARIVIGRDTRLSGQMFESALTAGITACGGDSYELGVVTTPGLAAITKAGKFDCGVMISASHNPFHDNGLKLLNGNGEKMEDDVIDIIEKYLDTPNSAPLVRGSDIGTAVPFKKGVDRYEKFLESVSKVRFDNIKIGLDCANGSASQIAPRVFMELGADVSMINVRPDGVNINEKCGSTHIETLSQFVKEKKLDIGFAFDGDADRCLCVDENGKPVDGDAVLYICARFLKEKGEFGNSKVVTTIMSNFGLYKSLDAIGIGYEKTDVGDKYVYECMKNGGHLIGGEQSGHTIFRKYATTGDGILTALQVMRVVVESGKTLSELAEPVLVYPQVLKNIMVEDKDEVMSDPYVKAAVSAMTEKLGENGRVLLRKSGTEPVIRVMAEAKTNDECAYCVDYIIDSVRGRGLLKGIR